MKRFQLALTIIALLAPALPTPAQFSPLCTVTGTLYYPDGSLAKNIPLTILRVEKTGMAAVRIPRVVYSNATSGVVTFTVPQSSTAWLYAEASVGATNLQRPGGVALAIPASSTATLESLGAAVTVPSQGITIKDEGVSLTNLAGTI